MNEKTYQELANLLMELGIDDITPQQLQELETQWNEYPEEIMAEGSLNKMTNLLTSVGAGQYDFKTATWQATSQNIFSFDMEAYDIENMYALLLKGIEAITGGDYHFENISESSNSEIGIGNQIIAFELNGTFYEFAARIQFDWYDINILSFLNDISRKQDNPRHLWFMTDGYQKVIVFYQEDAWVDRFEKMTGCELSK